MRKPSSSWIDKGKELPNPRPDNYKIIRHHKSKSFLVIEIKYLDCINYEGRKILVFKCELEDLLKQKLIDPHFSDDKNFISPIARFEPTEEGWTAAVHMLNYFDESESDLSDEYKRR